MNLSYPDRHHPIFMLQDALQVLGAKAEFNGRDERTLGCWGLIIESKPFVWLIDNRWPHEREHEDPAAAELLRRGALVCCAQQPDAQRVGAKWLPLAATPSYRSIPQEKLYDVAFVGYIRDEARARLLSDIASKFSVYHLSGVFGDEAVRAYCSARVAINIPTRFGDANAYDIPMRVWEILATGVPLVTNYLADLDELGFLSNINYAPYSGNAIAAAVEWALVHPEIGELGRQLVEQQHMYQHRAQTVLEWLAEV